jgi:transposase, IS6 family
MRSQRYAHSCPAPRSAFARYRFPPEVITLAVRWYLRFGLSYRDVEELLAERGIEVDHVSIYRWVQRFAPEFAEASSPGRHLVGDRWQVDDAYVRVGGAWRYLFRAVDQLGQVIDVFLRSPPTGTGSIPGSSTSCSRAAFHRTEVHANNRLETDHGPQSAAQTAARAEARP